MDLQTLKSWFVRGAKPTAAQFAATLESFWHKDDSIPMASVSGLEDEMNRRTIALEEYTEEEISDAIDNAERTYKVYLSDLDTTEIMLRNSTLDEEGTFYGWKSKESGTLLITYQIYPNEGATVYFYVQRTQAGIVQTVINND